MTNNTTQRAENAPIQAHHIIPVDVFNSLTTSKFP